MLMTISTLIQRECHHSGKFHCSNQFNVCTVAMMVRRRPSLKLSKVFEVKIIWSAVSLLVQTTKAPPRGAINSRILIYSVSTIFHSISITADVSMSMMNILWCALHCQIFIGRFLNDGWPDKHDFGLSESDCRARLVVILIENFSKLLVV